ncbi:hypothetical protein H0B56_20755 [Haloechinothrix sp. YIM 98757]|uniref:Uncharacterized protein n=1 Tax=Haloechinothrix aidingensis TaxID=2752311 RepID=A0A838AFF0_9PSEU|nr:hypothetical protein [Haloechinothrix aidingensis]MBA0127982.1 hypothetical protein [Haloechinothrix aidingensis]
MIAVKAKKPLIIVGGLLVLFFVMSQPGGAAGMVHSILGMLQSAAESLITFVSTVFNP